MADLLTSERMTEGDVSTASGRDASSRVIPAILLFGFMATSALWWHYGEAVYSSGIVTAFLACF